MLDIYVFISYICNNTRLLINVKWTICLLYHGDNKLHFDEMVMMYDLYYTNRLSWIIIVLAYWINNERIDMSLHLDTINYSESTSHSSYTLLLLGNRRSNKYWYNRSWFTIPMQFLLVLLVARLKYSLRKFSGRHYVLVNGYRLSVCVVVTIRSSFLLSWTVSDICNKSNTTVASSDSGFEKKTITIWDDVHVV